MSIAIGPLHALKFSELNRAAVRSLRKKQTSGDRVFTRELNKNSCEPYQLSKRERPGLWFLGATYRPASDTSSSGAPWRRNRFGKFCEKAERGSTMSQPTSWAFCFRSPCTWDRNPMIDVPFFNLLLSLGIRISGLALALFRSKMMSDGFSSPFCLSLS